MSDVITTIKQESIPVKIRSIETICRKCMHALNMFKLFERCMNVYDILYDFFKANKKTLKWSHFKTTKYTIPTQVKVYITELT